MNTLVKIAAATAVIVIVAGCGASPESRIRKACIADGGMNGSTQIAVEAADKQCTCFAAKLKSSLTNEQLEKVAKVIETPREQRKQASDAELDQASFPAVLGAAKSCAAQ